MITLKDRVKSYSQMSEVYLSAAETVIASDLHSTTEFLFVGPITQLLGHATELALKAQLLRYMEEEDVKAFNHNLGAAALALSKKSDILTLTEDYVAQKQELRSIIIPKNHLKHLTKLGRGAEDFYSFKLHFFTMAENYFRDRLNGDAFKTRYPPKHDFFRRYSHDILIVGLRFILNDMDELA